MTNSISHDDFLLSRFYKSVEKNAKMTYTILGQRLVVKESMMSGDIVPYFSL